MNYFEKHFGDYAKDTAHLSMLEHGAYSLLMDRYYGTERGIPEDDKYRQVRARTDKERAAVDAVLREFFKLGEDGIWRQGRVEEEIKRFQDGEPDRQAKREAKKARQDRRREERAKLFAPLREHGIVPSFDASMDDLREQASRVSKTPETRLETTTYSQTPDTNTSSTDVEEIKRGKRARRKSTDVEELWLTTEQMRDGNPDLTTEVAETYLAYRRNKKAPLTKIAWRDIVREVRKVGRSIDGALAYAINRNWQGFDATWVPGYGAGAAGAPPPSLGGRHARHAAALAELDEMMRQTLNPNGGPDGNAAGDDSSMSLPAVD